MIRVWLVAVLLSGSALTPPCLLARQQANSAAVPAERAEKIAQLRTEQQAYMGRNVRVHLLDGSTARGRLIGETSEGLALQPSPSDEPILIPYEQVESIASGMPRWQKIVLGAGAVAAAVAVAVGAS